MVGQINNVICYFNNFDSLSKLKLVVAYCTSHYGCEIWDLWSASIENYCVAWRKGIRRILGLPSDSHSLLLPVLSNVAPVMDDVCFRSFGFVSKCLSSDCSVMRFDTSHGVLSGMASVISRNVLFCRIRYVFIVNKVLRGHALLNVPRSITLKGSMKVLVVLRFLFVR